MTGRSLMVITSVALLAACGRSHSKLPTRDSGADAVVDGALDSSADGALDTGPDVDGSTGCDRLGPARCLGAGCVPTYDDACCPVCMAVGFCADCTNPDFFVCRTFADACMAAFCSMPALGACEGLEPDCEGASQVDTDSCNVAGCVPAIGPVGSPELPAVCVPIRASSCTALCRIEPPECVEGTTAEGDGSCYTGLCIPAFVCS